MVFMVFFLGVPGFLEGIWGFQALFCGVPGELKLKWRTKYAPHGANKLSKRKSTHI